MDKVELYADGALRTPRREVYPFQFRYTPPASAVGKTVQLTAKAIDAAGNTATSGTLFVNVVSAAGAVESPLPIADPTLDGSPVVGQTLTCVSGGFLNGPESFSVRSGCATARSIAGATGASYVPTTADVGRVDRLPPVGHQRRGHGRRDLGGARRLARGTHAAAAPTPTATPDAEAAAG